MSFMEEWDYTEEKPRSGEVITDKRRVYLHFYYNDQKATDDKARFNAMLDRLENNLVNGTPDPADEKLYQKYFVIKETPVRGKTYCFKEDAIRKAEKNYGYFVLMTNGIKEQMDEHGLFSTYTIQSLLDELDVIEYYQQPGKAHHLSEITQKQRDLYEMMNVLVPT